MDALPLFPGDGASNSFRAPSRKRRHSFFLGRASHVQIMCCHGCLKCTSLSAEVMQISFGRRHRNYRISPALILLGIFKCGLKAHPSEAFADRTKEASRAELRRKAFPQLREYEFSFPGASLLQEQEMCAWPLLNGISGILCLC